MHIDITFTGEDSESQPGTPPTFLSSMQKTIPEDLKASQTLLPLPFLDVQYPSAKTSASSHTLFHPLL